MVSILQKWRTKIKKTIEVLDENHSVLLKKLSKGESITREQMDLLNDYPDLLLKYRIFQAFLRTLPYNGLFKHRVHEIYRVLDELNINLKG